MNEPNKHADTLIGIHRVFREPYDDREVFTSIDDILEYCKNGARYNGQKIVHLTNQMVNKFTIINGYAVLDDHIHNAIVKDDEYLLIYYFNPASDGIMYDMDNLYSIYLNNSLQYSTIGYIDLFIKNSSNASNKNIKEEYEKDPDKDDTPVGSYATFMIEDIDIATGECTTLEWAQRGSIDTQLCGENVLGLIMDEGVSVYGIIVNGNIIRVIPKNDKKDKLVRLYIKCPDYIKAARGY